MLAKINKIQHQRSGNFFLMAGPCVIEDETMAMEIAEKILSITNKLEIPFIFKGSYRKANRSLLDSFTGIEMPENYTLIGYSSNKEQRIISPHKYFKLFFT